MHENAPSLLQRVAMLLAAFAVLIGILQLVMRPWYVHWGATSDEAVAELPGDAYLVATEQTTRAITLDAPAMEVWPWLTQLGQDRGGFYSYDLLEDMVGGQMPNVDTLRPALQTWRVGDKLWMYPAHRLNGTGHAVLRQIVPGKELVFDMRHLGTPLTSPPDATWAFVLRPIDADHTRLLVRGRAGGGPRSLALKLVDRLAFEPVHFMMERKMLTGIAARVGGHRATPTTDAMEIGVFATCVYMIASACLRLLRERGAARMTYLVLGLGVTFQFLTFFQPPWFLGGIPVATLGFYVGAETLIRRNHGKSVGASDAKSDQTPVGS